MSAAARGGLLAAAALLAAYLLTLAPGVTLWDAGEFVAAVHGFGVPHPPGTPLFVAAGRAWTLALAPLGTALAANLLSAVATAAAVALAALLVAGRAGTAAVVAAALAAGGMASLWRNATETEVYALALLLAVLTLAAADRAGRSTAPGARSRWLLLVAYLFGVAIPIHQFALVAAPAALVLAGTDERGRLRAGDVAALLGALLLVVGLGTVRPPLAAAGLAASALATVLARRGGGEGAPPPAGGGVGAGLAAGMLLVALLGLGALAILPLRAALDPALNQGNPATWDAFLDVLARRQYAVAPLWPRQAPLWLQLGNVLEWADWQVALGPAPGAAPSWRRTPFTLLFALFGVAGALEHRRLDHRGWRAALVLLLAASVGVVLYLNLKAGPSYGAGVLPPDAPREARERDYFFVFAFLVWGLWAGLGAWALSARLLAGRRWPGVLAAALPLALNAPAVDRARGADAALARDVAAALLAGAPRNSILLTAGDNDSYPSWYLQQVEGVRPDVLVVATSLLPAWWYRDELARRDALGARVPRGAPWPGLAQALVLLDTTAQRQGRPVVVSALVPGPVRALVRGPWALGGVLYHRELAGAPGAAGAPVAAGSGRWTAGVPAVDRARARAVAPLVRRQLGADGLPLPAEEAAMRTTRRLLACAPLAASPPAAGRDSLLASWCNRR